MEGDLWSVKGGRKQVEMEESLFFFFLNIYLSIIITKANADIIIFQQNFKHTTKKLEDS